MNATVASGVSGLADQRYYHFITIRESRLSFQNYWRKCGDVRMPVHALDTSDERVELQHRKLRSNWSFARGAVAARLSAKGDGEPPFYYDLIAMRTDIAGVPFLFVGFPFFGLALEVVRRLTDSRDLPGTGRFAATDVAGLVTTMEVGFGRRYEGLNVHVVGVQFVVADDKYLTSVRLGGDDPLSAEIYQGFLRRRLARRHIVPDHCSLACEREWGSVNNQLPSHPQLLRSRIHFDNKGNYRVYAQAGCANLLVLPYAVGQLQTAGLLSDVAQNPLLRASEVEE